MRMNEHERLGFSRRDFAGLSQKSDLRQRASGSKSLGSNLKSTFRKQFSQEHGWWFCFFVRWRKVSLELGR